MDQIHINIKLVLYKKQHNYRRRCRRRRRRHRRCCYCVCFSVLEAFEIPVRARDMRSCPYASCSLHEVSLRQMCQCCCYCSQSVSVFMKCPSARCASAAATAVSVFMFLAHYVFSLAASFGGVSASVC
jgi:hypothetical protein